jgi:hypothetical protein
MFMISNIRTPDSEHPPLPTADPANPNDPIDSIFIFISDSYPAPPKPLATGIRIAPVHRQPNLEYNQIQVGFGKPNMTPNHRQPRQRPHQPRRPFAAGSLVLLFLLLSFNPATAGEPRTATEPVVSTDTYGWSGAALGFGAGILAAYAFHEGAHWAVAGITGTELDWESGTYNQPLGFTEEADSDTNGALLHGAGLAGQALCGEVILAMDRIDKTHPMVRGMMFWNIVNPVIYAIDYWFLHSSNRIEAEGYQGDLAGIEHYAGKDVANTFAAATLGLALWQGYRFWNAQERTPAPTDYGLRLGMAPAPSGGAMITFQIPF